MNLVEQLRAHAIATAGDAWRVDARTLLAKAADTIEAQSRLLPLAETLAGAVAHWKAREEKVNRPWTMYSLDLCGKVDAFTTALTEYQTTGTVPCGECERLQSNLKQADENHRLMYANLTRTEADNADLRRQLAEAHLLNRDLADQVVAWNETEAYRSERENGIIESQQAYIDTLTGDNAALVEALRRVNENLDTHTATGREAIEVIRAALSRPHPGAPMLEELGMLGAAEQVLIELCQLKHYKDDNGKDEFYQTNQQKAWKAANSVLNALAAIRNRESRHE